MKKPYWKVPPSRPGVDTWTKGGKMTRPVQVGKRILELREDTGLTLQELAEQTGYSSADNEL
jgi:hypothetical protein